MSSDEGGEFTMNYNKLSVSVNDPNSPGENLNYFLVNYSNGLELHTSNGNRMGLNPGGIEYYDGEKRRLLHFPDHNSENTPSIPISVNGIVADKSGNITLPSGGGSSNRIEGEGWHVGESESTKGIEAVSDKQIDLKADKVSISGIIELTSEEGYGVITDNLSTLDNHISILEEGMLIESNHNGYIELFDGNFSLKGKNQHTYIKMSDNYMDIMSDEDINLAAENISFSARVPEGSGSVGVATVTVGEIYEELFPHRRTVDFGPYFSQNEAFGEESLIRRGKQVYYKMFANKLDKIEVGDLVFTIPKDLRPRGPEFIVGHGGDGSTVVWLMIDPKTGGVHVQEFPNKEEGSVVNGVILSGSYFY